MPSSPYAIIIIIIILSVCSSCSSSIFSYIYSSNDQSNIQNPETSEQPIQEPTQKQPIPQQPMPQVKRIQTLTKKAIVLGPYDMPPWHVKHDIFKNSKWIWNTSNANIETSNVPVEFEYIYNNKTDKTLPISIYAMFDNIGELFINNSKVCDVVGGWDDPNRRQCDSTILPGDNSIKLTGRNDGGPGGAILTANVDGVNVINTDEKWMTN